jgi:hypothetical protein
MFPHPAYFTRKPHTLVTIARLQLAAYPHMSDVVFVEGIDTPSNDSEKLTTPSTVLQCGSTVTQVKYVYSGPTNNPVLILAVLTNEGLQVWEPNERQRLASIAVKTT